MASVVQSCFKVSGVGNVRMMTSSILTLAAKKVPMVWELGLIWRLSRRPPLAAYLAVCPSGSVLFALIPSLLSSGMV